MVPLTGSGHPDAGDASVRRRSFPPAPKGRQSVAWGVSPRKGSQRKNQSSERAAVALDVLSPLRGWSGMMPPPGAGAPGYRPPPLRGFPAAGFGGPIILL